MVLHPPWMGGFPLPKCESRVEKTKPGNNCGGTLIFLSPVLHYLVLPLQWHCAPFSNQKQDLGEGCFLHPDFMEVLILLKPSL